MIEPLLIPLVSERFRSDARYRAGHIRVVNPLPGRRVLGLHVPAMKQIARELAAGPDAAELIARFEQTPPELLTYEETVVWGLMLNRMKLPLAVRFDRFRRFVPVMDNWAVCDICCCDARWMRRAGREELWAFLQPFFGAKREFEVRFAVVVAMSCLLEEPWLDRLFARLSALDFGEIASDYRTASAGPEPAGSLQPGTVRGRSPYYVRMGVAWLLATALAKFPDRVRAYVPQSGLPDDVVRLYLRKARESFRTRTMAAL